MKLAAGVGTSTNDNGYEAGLEATTEVAKQLGSQNPDFVFIFSTIGYEHEDLLEAVSETFGDVPISGATFEGIIGRGIADESMYAVQVIGFKCENVNFYNFSCTNSVDNPGIAGANISVDRSKLLRTWAIVSCFSSRTSKRMLRVFSEELKSIANFRLLVGCQGTI